MKQSMLSPGRSAAPRGHSRPSPRRALHLEPVESWWRTWMVIGWCWSVGKRYSTRTSQAFGAAVRGKSASSMNYSRTGAKEAAREKQ